MHTLISFIQTVAAQVVAYYLCSWIDGKIGKAANTKRSPPVLRIPGGFAFGMNPLRTLISLPTLIICASGQKSRWSEKFNTCPSGELANP